MARIKHGTLNNDQVDVVLGGNYAAVEVLVRSGDAELWVCGDPLADASGSIAEQDDVDVLPAGPGSLILDSNPNTDPTVVRLETTGTVAWSVKGLDA